MNPRCSLYVLLLCCWCAVAYGYPFGWYTPAWPADDNDARGEQITYDSSPRTWYNKEIWQNDVYSALVERATYFVSTQVITECMPSQMPPAPQFYRSEYSNFVAYRDYIYSMKGFRIPNSFTNSVVSTNDYYGPEQIRRYVSKVYAIPTNCANNSVSNLACADIVKHRGLGTRGVETNYYDGTNAVVVRAWNWDYLRTAIDGATNVSLKPYFVAQSSIPGTVYIDGSMWFDAHKLPVWIDNTMRFGSLDPLRSIVSNCWCGPTTNAITGSSLHGAPQETYSAYALTKSGVNQHTLRVKLDTEYIYTITGCTTYVSSDTTGNYTGYIACVGTTPTSYSLIDTGGASTITINISGNSIRWNGTFSKSGATRPGCGSTLFYGDGGYVEFAVELTNWANNISLNMKYDDDGTFP